MNDLQLWGGIECTLNRVGDAFGDQCHLTGHQDRPEDLAALAALGITALRYPVLWERVSPDDPQVCDWTWIDARLKKLRELDVDVIAGLVHHGSGPKYTDLLQDDFASGLAVHARNVAERYPWINNWTPVNEPLTTARFAALYGHWYPHHRDEGSFWRALLNQVDGVRLSMNEIRKVNPAARLIQTEDLGRTYSTRELADRAAFYNERRWATWDLLCGRLTADHPLWDYISGFGLGDRLRAIADEPCPPDVLGVNHYLTSDRFLDGRLSRYPGEGGAASYVDMEAIRVMEPAGAGFEGALREAWQRYDIGIAITEVHNHSTREEQMRWMAEVWDTATALRQDGVRIEAVTTWAMLGSSGWDTLLTGEGSLETGVYCHAGDLPRATAMVELLKGLPSGAQRHPVLAGEGWWRRPIRHLHPTATDPSHPHTSAPVKHPAVEVSPDLRHLLICGATGTLGQALAHACQHRNIAFVLTGRAELDLTDRAQVAAVLDTHRPWAVINAAGYVRVDEAEVQQELCIAGNVTGPINLAEACTARDIATVNFSSDLVFDGHAGRPYVEEDATSPLNVYGRSKAAAEEALAGLGGTHLVVRTAAFFSPFDEHNFAVAVVRTLLNGNRFRAAADASVSPTFVPHLVRVVLDLTIDGEGGIWHLTNDRALSWAEFAVAIARACKLDERLIDAVPAADMGWLASRPTYVPLGSSRSALMPTFDAAMDAFTSEIARQGRYQLAVA